MAIPNNIANATVGNMSATVDDYSVDPIELDSPTGTYGWSWKNNKFSQYMGYYKKISEWGSTVDIKSTWAVGEGYDADDKTKKILDTFRGAGKDTFLSIIDNQVRIMNVGGDSFAEIIRDDSKFSKILTWFGFVEKGKPINLKPLNPARMSIITNEQGFIIKYEYSNGTNQDPTIFEPEDIFHLAWNRTGDEPHGTSPTEKIEGIILKRNEAMDDLQKVFHRYVKPLWIWQLDTDNPTKIAAFKAKADQTVENSENIYIPKGAAEAERMSVPQYSSLDPLPWIEYLTQYFYQAANVPDVVLGSAKQTVEASAKILFEAYRKTIIKQQVFLENNIKTQLGFDLTFIRPPSLLELLQKDAQKDGDGKMKKSDMELNMDGKK